MKKLYYLILLLTPAMLIISCSEIQDNITPPLGLSLHNEGINDPKSENFHGKLIKSLKWDLKNCQQCHARDYSGGTTGSSCLNCHKQSKGPEACNTCHGDFADPAMVSPPRDLSGRITPESKGVGAHIEHMLGEGVGKPLSCNECHKVPLTLYEEGHLDESLPAEVIFGELSRKNVRDSVIYDYVKLECSNTYCHGNFSFPKSKSSYPSMYSGDRMIGNNSKPVWNIVDGTYKKCNVCHGKSEADPSPIGHVASSISTCGVCHSDVVDRKGKIINSTKHINGKINVFGLEIER